MYYKQASAIILCIVSFGCASSYRPPSEGPTAKLQLRSNVGAGRGAMVFADEQCSRPQLISPFDEGKWMAIRAGAPLWLRRDFNTLGLPGGIYCAAFLTFTPAANESYVVQFTQDQTLCDVKAFHLDAQGKETPETSARPFENAHCAE